MKKIVIISIAIHVLAIIVLAPWAVTRMEFNKDAEAKRVAEVRKRELARVEHERRAREKRKLDEATAKKLRRETERRKQESMALQVEKLRKLRDEIMQRQQKELSQIEQRTQQDILDAEQQTLNRLAENFRQNTSRLTSMAMQFSFCIGGYVNGYEHGVNGIIDNLHIHRKALEPPFPDSGMAHQFLFDDNLTDRVTGKSGILQYGAVLADSPLTGGKAFTGNGVNGRAQLWPIDLGDQFTLIAQIKLNPKPEAKSSKRQLLFTNRTFNAGRGFEVYVEPTPTDATASHIVITTRGTGKTDSITRSTPQSLPFGRLCEVTISINKTKEVAKIFIDGLDVTADDGQLAADFKTPKSSIDRSSNEQAVAIEQDIKQNQPTPESSAQLMESIQELKEKIAKRGEENKDIPYVGTFAKRATAAAEELNNALSKLKEKTNLETMNDTSTSLADKMQPTGPETTKASLAELYREAREIEQQMGEAYADMAASTRAKNDNTSYTKARESSHPNTPSRPELESQLGDASNLPATIGELSEFRDAVDRASSEVRDIRARAENMVYGANITRTLSSKAASQFASSQNQGYGAVIDMTGSSSDGDIELSRDLRVDGSGEGSAMASGKVVSRIQLDERAIMPKALPGRRFTEDSIRKGWLYIDTWYVIGPWENHSAVNFDRVHRPERGVDFDAKYTDGKFSHIEGHPDQILKWRFYQSDSVRCQPFHVHGAATYYAYTEVWFEQERDMLIAVASDDAARVWLNGQNIWQDTGQSVWKLGEGYRRVRFKKGFNSLLVRVENGPGYCVWSVLLCPPEVAHR